jgi:hypothetical protein
MVALRLHPPVLQSGTEGKLSCFVDVFYRGSINGCSLPRRDVKNSTPLKGIDVLFFHLVRIEVTNFT